MRRQTTIMIPYVNVIRDARERGTSQLIAPRRAIAGRPFPGPQLTAAIKREMRREYFYS